MAFLSMIGLTFVLTRTGTHLHARTRALSFFKHVCRYVLPQRNKKFKCSRNYFGGVEVLPRAGTAWRSLPDITIVRRTPPPPATRLYLTPYVTWCAADRGGGRVLISRASFINTTLLKPPDIKELTDGSGGVGAGPGQLSR